LKGFLSRPKALFWAAFLLLVVFWTLTLSGKTIPGAAQTKPALELPRLFTDLHKDYWAYNTINQLVERSLLIGYPDGTFRPDNILSRAEFAALLARAAGLALEPVDKPAHQDVGLSIWYARVVGATYKYIGDFAGPAGSRLFKPGKPILREQAIAAFLKARNDDNKIPINQNILAAKFKDYRKITPEYRSMLAWAVEQGLVVGDNEGAFRPQGILTRAEAAALVTRLFPKIEISIKAFLESGKLVPLDSTEPQYKQLVDKLQQDYPVIAVEQTPVKLQYYAGDFPPVGGSKEKALYVFVAVDPLKYFTFSDVDFKNKPDAVAEFNEAIALEANSIFPDKQVMVLIGYTNTLYYDPHGVYEARFISYNKSEQAWQVIRYYTGVRVQESKILEKWRGE
jgi:hypothetical protein